MKKAWSVILAIVFVAILLGAVSIGVGYLTGADMDQIYHTMEGSPLYNYVQSLVTGWQQGFAAAQQIMTA